jgi:hypothetical protein
MVLLVKGFENKCTCGLEGKGPKIVGGTPAEVFNMQYKICVAVILKLNSELDVLGCFLSCFLVFPCFNYRWSMTVLVQCILTGK